MFSLCIRLGPGGLLVCLKVGGLRVGEEKNMAKLYLDGASALVFSVPLM